MRYVLVLCFLVIFGAIAAARPETKDGFKPAPEGDERRELRKEDIVKQARIGMTKKDLYKLFGKYYRTGYRREGEEEWITFSDRKRSAPGGITFYLQKGKVKSWERK